MATNIVQSLFGMTPQLYQQTQQDRADEQALQYAQLDPFQQANFAIGRGATGLGNALGGALGGQDPQLKMIGVRQAVAKQINPSDPASIQQGIAALQQSGDAQGAFMLQEEYRKMQESGSLVGQREASAKASLAQAGKEAKLSIPTDIQLAREISSLQEQISQLTDLPPSPERNQALRLASGQLVELQRLTNKNGEKPVNPKIDSIGLAADTNQKGKNVYLDPINDIQFTYGVDATGKQVRVPYNGSLAQKTSGEGGGGAGGAAGTGTVEVVDPKDRTKTIIVTKARAVAEGLTPAKAIDGLTPQMRQNLEKSYPQATASLRSYQSKSALFIKDLEDLRDSEGLDSITGFAAGRGPGFTDAGRKAVALYDKVIAKGGFQTLQDMRDMSKTGGALGNVSDRENQQLKAAFAAIDRKQSAADVRTALDDLIKELRGGLGRLKDVYDLTYEYRKANTAPTASGVDATNPLLK